MKNVSQQLLSGGLSGFTSTICLQPFDLLKTRVQQGDGSTKTRHTTFILRTAKDIIATNGPAGLWRGTVATLARNVPGVALYMTTLTQLRTLMATSPYFAAIQSRCTSTSHASVLPVLTSQGNLLAGATARVAVGFILNPFTVLKARFESDMYAYQSFSSALGSIVRQGPSEMFRGVVVSSMRDAPYAGLFVVFYEGIKRETAAILPSSSNAHSAGVHSFAAASAGTIATMCTQPFDVIKTKIQVRKEVRYHGLARTIATVFNQRGIAGFFDGASLRLSRKILSSAIGWAVYEGVLLFMRTT